MWNLRIITVFFIALILHCATVNGQTAEHYMRLDGSHKFSSGDNLAWASTSYDDSQWRSITIPGSWQSQEIKSEKGLGWYRIHFATLNYIRSIQPAILLGRIGDADEVFINGIKIGGEGLISNRFVEATKITRLYNIPSNLLRYDGDNLIAIRVMNTYLNGGIFDRDIMIGDYSYLLAKKLSRDINVIAVEFCFFTFFSIFFITCFFFYIQGLRDKEYIYFWLFVTVYGIIFTLGSITFYNSGLKTPLVQQIMNTLAAVLPAGLVLLLMRLYQKELPFYMKSILLLFLLVALSTILVPDYYLREYLYDAWKIIFILTAGFWVIFSIKAYLIRRSYESSSILLGIVGLIAGLILESVGGLDLLQITGFFLRDYSAGFFMVCIMYALTARYTRIKKDLHSASLRIFDAHEDERERVARELHDGIGPSLLGIKLKLQMLEAKAKECAPVEKGEFPELVSDISDSIEELRAIAMDLRPSFLENIDIEDAIGYHATKVQEKLGIKINIKAGNLKKINARTKDNLYRIYQEALNNVIKHSGATLVDIILKMKGNFLSFEIKDNGKGFDPVQAKKKGAGLGLYTIQERIELLRGILKIRSSDKMGTSVYLEVPVD